MKNPQFSSLHSTGPAVSPENFDSAYVEEILLYRMRTRPAQLLRRCDYSDCDDERRKNDCSLFAKYMCFPFLLCLTTYMVVNGLAIENPFESTFFSALNREIIKISFIIGCNLGTPPNPRMFMYFTLFAPDFSPKWQTSPSQNL